MDREKGFEDVIAKEFPGIQIVARQFGMSDRAKARAAAENILTAHTDLAGVFASAEPSGNFGFTSIATLVAFGTSCRIKSKRFGPISMPIMVVPVTLPPGRLRLATSPASTGSPPAVNTIGMELVAALAASGDGSPPVAAITAT